MGLLDFRNLLWQVKIDKLALFMGPLQRTLTNKRYSIMSLHPVEKLSFVP